MINLPEKVTVREDLEIIRASGGNAIGIPEREIEDMLARVWREKRWWISPEGAACLAAVPRLLDSSELKPGESVVVFNTGSLEKYLPSLRPHT